MAECIDNRIDSCYTESRQNKIAQPGEGESIMEQYEVWAHPKAQAEFGMECYAVGPLQAAQEYARDWMDVADDSLSV